VPGSFVAVELGPGDAGAADDLRLLGAALARGGVDVRVEGWGEVPGEPEALGGAIADRPPADVRLAPGPPSVTLGGGATVVARTGAPGGALPRAWAERLARAERIWVPTAAARDALAQAGIEPGRLAVVPTPIDAERFTPVAAPIDLGAARSFRFLAVLDWKLRRGWDVLVRAFVEEFAEHEDVSLVLKVWSSLGYRTEWIGHAIEGVIRDLGRDPRTVPDLLLEMTPMAPEALPGLYRAADCVVAPSRAQAWGRPVLEAMACGVPVIATAVGGMLDSVVHGVTGLHVPPRDPGGIARAAHELLADPARRKQMAAAGVRRARELFCWERVAGDTLEVYRHVVERSTTRRGVLA
jgi:glycosyltransferase involved in cell wall biosynthesis